MGIWFYVFGVKFNCDAAWQKEFGKVGMVFVAHNCNKEVLLSGARSEFYANWLLEAEAKVDLVGY